MLRVRHHVDACTDVLFGVQCRLCTVTAPLHALTGVGWLEEEGNNIEQRFLPDIHCGGCRLLMVMLILILIRMHHMHQRWGLHEH
jgi:hypothetical protein